MKVDSGFIQMHDILPSSLKSALLSNMRFQSQFVHLSFEAILGRFSFSMLLNLLRHLASGTCLRTTSRAKHQMCLPYST
uniref:Uncharacterized protein n=1 Tax=Physcomitrium patens TaxID=3218 RepID=A0A2K1II39_PHYPA|nr:hypothetical protein PHYPA_027633 [Physcomitrium patens]